VTNDSFAGCGMGGLLVPLTAGKHVTLTVVRGPGDCRDGAKTAPGPDLKVT
jgi:hypothetical protein